MSKECSFYECKNHCGHCCIICTDISLTIEEVKEGKYEMQKRRSKNVSGWSNKTVKRERIYNNEVGKVYACFYLDEKKLECTVYKNRPLVCKQFNCKKHKYGKKEDITMDMIWEEMVLCIRRHYCFDE